ncbi:MAG: hypothetical protein ABGX27_03840 [Desulfurobacteriaceae bacterium]
MTYVVHRCVKCDVCGAVSTQRSVMSFSYFGNPSLDFRKIPPFFNLQVCPNCTYTDYEIGSIEIEDEDPEIEEMYEELELGTEIKELLRRLKEEDEEGEEEEGEEIEESKVKRLKKAISKEKEEKAETERESSQESKNISFEDVEKCEASALYEGLSAGMITEDEFMEEIVRCFYLENNFPLRKDYLIETNILPVTLPVLDESFRVKFLNFSLRRRKEEKEKNKKSLKVEVFKKLLKEGKYELIISYLKEDAIRNWKELAYLWASVINEETGFYSSAGINALSVSDYFLEADSV